MKVFMPMVDMLNVAGGDSYGYVNARKMAIEALKEHLGEQGEQTWFHYTPPHFFKPQDLKFNVLFTMWEAENFPQEFVDSVNKADLIITPSRHSKEVLKRSGVFKTIKVCKLGVNTDFFYCKPKERTTSKFQVLWLGAPNIRKGFDLATKAYWQTFREVTEAWMYLKSSLYDKEGILNIVEEWKATLDTRNVSREEIRQLYYDSDVLLYPSYGEGAGLIPMEAMSTGLPVIAPAYSGMRDYIFPYNSFPVSFKMVDVYYGCPTKVAYPDLDSLCSQLWSVYKNVDLAREKGVRGSRFIRDNHSLESFKESLLSILKEIKL